MLLKSRDWHVRRCRFLCIMNEDLRVHPLIELAYGDLAQEAELPAGVLNSITGAAEAGAALTRDRRLRELSFTERRRCPLPANLALRRVEVKPDDVLNLLPEPRIVGRASG